MRLSSIFSLLKVEEKEKTFVVIYVVIFRVEIFVEKGRENKDDCPFGINGFPQAHGDIAKFGVPFLAMPVKSRFFTFSFLAFCQKHQIWHFAKNKTSFLAVDFRKKEWMPKKGVLHCNGIIAFLKFFLL